MENRKSAWKKLMIGQKDETISGTSGIPDAVRTPKYLGYKKSLRGREREREAVMAPLAIE